MKPGNNILIADGSISIRVDSIESDTVLKGTVLNTKKLGERKNCNLPGVKVELDVLQPKDINDVQNFCCKNKMDFVAASFVQTGEDVQLIRRILDEAGGQNVQIISKIENEAGMENFDEILKYTDGVMVARGDLGMEIPSEKVALAQKMMITKCNIAGKFVIVATQMLESMCDNPLPTRAEMLDVANAVFDGADATMLSGETANGAFPAKAVSTMSAITKNAEEGLEGDLTYQNVWNNTPKPVSPLEAVSSGAVKACLDMGARAMVVFADVMLPATLVSKYKPPVPIVVVTTKPSVASHCNVVSGLVPMLLDTVTTSRDDDAHGDQHHPQARHRRPRGGRRRGGPGDRRRAPRRRQPHGVQPRRGLRSVQDAHHRRRAANVMKPTGYERRPYHQLLLHAHRPGQRRHPLGHGA